MLFTSLTKKEDPVAGRDLNIWDYLIVPYDKMIHT